MENEKFNVYRFLVGFAAFVIVIAGIKAASSIVVPILLSVFIATISAPAIFKLEKFGIPKIVAFFIVLSFVVFILLGFAYILSTSLDSFLANTPVYSSKIISLIGSLKDVLEKFGVIVSKSDLETMFNPSGALNFAGSFLKSFSAVLSKSFLIFLGVTFMLFESSSLKTKIYLLTNKENSSKNPFDEFSEKLNSYLAIKSIVSLITGACISLGLSIIGVDFALLLGVVAFLLNFIPAIGSILAAIPAILVALVGLDLNSVFWVVLLYLSVNVLMGNIIEPKFLGKGLGLSVLVIFISLLFWGWVLGSVGMFLAVPISMTLKLALESNPKTKKIAMILST